jgi:glycosyltransferase involved in cell wall biosynthesis
MITLIATVLNEGDNIHRLLDSLARQTRQPDEIVIVDGGSTDQTPATIEGYTDRLPLRLLVEPGANISTGRNRAIAAAQGDIIATTDAGVVLDETWLENLTRPLLDDPALNVVGGFFLAEADTVFEAAMGATVLPLSGEINPATFLPSSRSVAFRKTAWERVGGYPEWLDYCEDLIFDFRLKATVGPLAFAPEAVAHFRPRRTLRSFYTQYYRYARGDGKADLWRKRHAIRYLTYLVVLPAVLLLGALLHPLVWAFILPGAAAYLYQPYRRLPVVLRRAGRTAPGEWLAAALLVPVIRVGGDVAKMIGYPAGWRWRLRHHPPDWKQV